MQPAARRRALFWALLALTVSTRLAVALANHHSLIDNGVYQDDAFYYLRIASNVVHGRGLTFDGAAPTNGFHPLYLLLLLPIVALSGGNLALPIHLSAVMLTAWATATAVVLHGLLARLANDRVALFGMLVWAICPYFILMGVNGLETGVAILFGLLVPSLYLRWFHGDEPPDARRALAFGAVCGLALLARIDLALLVAAIGVDLLARRAARSGPSLVPGGLALAGLAAIWLPWAAVSHAATGHWLPLSGAASRQIALNFGWLNLRPIWSHVAPGQMLFDPAHVPAAYHLDVATKLAAAFLFENPLLAPARANLAAGPWTDLDHYLPYRLLASNAPLAVIAGLMIVLPIAVLARARLTASSSHARPQLRTIRRLLAVYLLLTAVGYVFYAPVHWYFNRYLAPAILLTCAWLLVEVGRFRAGPRARAVAVALGLAVVACQLAEGRFFARLRWTDTPPSGFLASWTTLGAGVDPRARIGAFQAGIYGYFSGRDIINLDGKVNQDAYAAVRDRRLHEYVRAQGIRYILDVEWMLQTFWLRYAPPGSVSYRSVGGAGGSRVQLFEIVDHPGPP
jgi:hypothetical protein